MLFSFFKTCVYRRLPFVALISKLLPLISADFLGRACRHKCWYFVPVYTVLCYTVAKHGLCWVFTRRKPTTFTYNAFAVFLKFDGYKKLPTRKCWDVLNSSLYTLPLAILGFAGIFWEWATSESQSLCCIGYSWN